MTNELSLASLSDDELLRQLSVLIGRSRQIEAEVVAHIAEVDSRRLYLGQACSSMHAYCVEVLHLSDAEAYLRITVARASRRFPLILAMIGDGRLHLSGIAKLAPHLTEENAESLLSRAVHRSKREIEELVAEVAPRPDVPERTRKLPTPSARDESPSGPGEELRPDGVDRPALIADEPANAGARTAAPPPPKRAVIEPLAPYRYKVELTVSSELKEKLERARGLLRHRGSDCDLATVIDEAVTMLLQKLEARRFGKTSAPRKTVAESDTSARSRHIPAAIRRQVFERDGGRCTFVSAGGKRCSCTDPGKLEFHHIHPYGRGGDHDPSQITLRCRAHNAHQAELDYGAETIARKKKKRASDGRAIYCRERMMRGGSGESLPEPSKGGRERALRGLRPLSPVIPGTS